MSRQGPTGIRIRGGSDCVIDRCGFFGLGTAVDLEGGERHRVTNSHFQDNRRDINIRDGVGHAILDNVFEGKRPSETEGLKAIRERWAKECQIERYWRPFMLCFVNTTKKQARRRAKVFARQMAD